MDNGYITAVSKPSAGKTTYWHERCKDLGPQTVASFYRHQSSSGANGQGSTASSRAFPVAGPKTWNALLEDVTSSK